MLVKGDVVKDIIESVKSLPFVEEVYLITPKEGADLGLRVKVKESTAEQIIELVDAINKVAMAGDNPEDWVFVYWEWEEEKK